MERVLRRAVELAGHLPTAAEPDTRVPVDVLHQVAEELAIPHAAVAQALAEERAAEIHRPGRGPSRSVTDRIFGPGEVQAVAGTRLPPDRAMVHLDQWLERRHHLRVRHPTADTVGAVRRQGLMPSVTHSVRAATGTAGLATAREVRAAVAGTEPGAPESSVVVVADIRNRRARSVAAGSAVAAGTSAVVAVAALLTAPVTLVGVPVALGGGWAVARLTHHRGVKKVRIEVEITASRSPLWALPPPASSRPSTSSATAWPAPPPPDPDPAPRCAQ
ncbi:MAG: hypothetical protein R2761_28045 [Acidimicrobiales bacterium]